jgi:hypothetical protein
MHGLRYQTAEQFRGFAARGEEGNIKQVYLLLAKRFLKNLRPFFSNVRDVLSSLYIQKQSHVNTSTNASTCEYATYSSSSEAITSKINQGHPLPLPKSNIGIIGAIICP